MIVKQHIPFSFVAAIFMACLATSCGKKDFNSSTESDQAKPEPAAGSQLTIGVSFDTVKTEFWAAAMDAFKKELAKRNMRMVEAVAQGDADRQAEQVRDLINRKVDGIVLVPQDAKACIPVIKSANEANIPIVLFNRPAAESDTKSVAVVGDNFTLAKETVAYMVSQGRKTGEKLKAMLLIGDLGDLNAVARRDGFEAAVREAGDFIDVRARVPTDWSQEKAQKGVVDALNTDPDINFIFTSSDSLLPAAVSVLTAAGRYNKVGEPGHVILGGFDGDATAYRMLTEGYLDATGVVDLYAEVEACIQAVQDLKAGKEVPRTKKVPGFVIHQDNFKEKATRMSGTAVKK